MTILEQPDLQQSPTSTPLLEIPLAENFHLTPKPKLRSTNSAEQGLFFFFFYLSWPYHSLASPYLQFLSMHYTAQNANLTQLTKNLPQNHFIKKEVFFFFFFDRKRQRDILKEKRSTREGWEILPPKKTKLQEYKNKKVHSKHKLAL